LLLELAVVGVWQIRLIGERSPELAAPQPADTEVHASPWTGIARVVRTPYLVTIVAYVLCTATAATFLYLEQAAIVKAAFAHLADGAARVARTDFFASLDLWTAAITFVPRRSRSSCRHSSPRGSCAGSVRASCCACCR
jgi:ATP:ADP antiporter, AAA family